MDKYVISQQHEKEMVIEDFPSDLDHIPVILNDDLPSSEASELVQDMLQSDSSVRVLMIGESHYSASVLSCEAKVASSVAVYSATFDTVSEVEHVWSSAVAGLDRLQVVWLRRGVAVLLSRSALPAHLPRLKSPNLRGKAARGRGGPVRGKGKRNYRGPHNCPAPDNSKPQSTDGGNNELQKPSEELGAVVPHSIREGTSNGARSKTWAASDKSSRSRARGAREKSLGDFLHVEDLRSAKDVQGVPAVTARAKCENKKSLSNNKICESSGGIRLSLEHEPTDIRGNLSLQQRESSNFRERVSQTRDTLQKISYSPAKKEKTSQQHNTIEKEPNMNDACAGENKSLVQNIDQLCEVRPSNCSSLQLEAKSKESVDEGSKLDYRHNSLETVSASSYSGAQGVSDKKKTNMERKVSFHIPLVSHAADKETSEPSVKPKIAVLESPRSNKRNNGKNSKKNDQDKRNLTEYSSSPPKSQAMSAKVC